MTLKGEYLKVNLHGEIHIPFHTHNYYFYIQH